MEAIHELEPIIILLLAGILAVTLMKPLKMSPIVGYLLAGILIGPDGFAIIEESKTTHLLAELGVVFLLFDIGLHFSLGHIWDARREILGLGPIQVLFCTLALAGFPLAFSFDPVLSFIIGAGLALSSTAVVAQVLAGYNQNSCPIGSGAMAVLIFQDICAIFLLILADSFGGDSSSLLHIMGAAALKALGAFLLTIVIGKYLSTPILKGVSSLKNEEIFTASALLIVLAMAAFTGFIGLSLTLGAFLAGMMISETPYRHFIQTEIKPFRGLLVSFFFITIGMSLNAETLFHSWWQIILVVVILIFIKTLFIYLAALTLKSSNKISMQLGFLLSQGSEFAFVVFSLPHINKLLGEELSAVLIAAVALSMALTSPLAKWGYQFAEKIENRRHRLQPKVNADSEMDERKVIVIGMGDIGRCVCDGLEAHGISYKAIEIDHDLFTQANRDGYPVVFGDATDLRLMDAIEIAQANLLVITEPRFDLVNDIAPVVKKKYPNLVRFASVENDQQRDQLDSFGIQSVKDRSFPKGLDLASTVLKSLNSDEKKLANWMQRQQSRALENKVDLKEMNAPFLKERFFDQEKQH
jgi:monovalent cation:proton antiporter-2 (CPA2) family protein